MRTHIAFPFAVALAATLLALHARAEPFIDLGIHATRVDADISGQPMNVTSTESGLHLGVGLRRPVRERGEIGVRIELDNVDSNLLLAVRAFDYRFRRSDRVSFGAFAGAARLDLATPAYGYYLGGGVHFKDFVPGWELSTELRLGDEVARDNVLPTDPQGGDSPDNFYDLYGITLYLSRRF